jgi:thiol-disulfide isomerase/thioredoxin
MRAALSIVACAVALAGCGSDEASAPAAGSPAPDDPAQGDMPPELADLRKESGALLDGGADAFRSRLDELEGHPVVVNKWASWCGPCRAEFPFFRSQADQRAGKVAFIGVNSSDNDDAAENFLGEFPVPYPSYKDPDLDVAEVFHGVAAFPTTAFYDPDGELAYLKQGGYSTEQQLVEDIERYAK